MPERGPTCNFFRHPWMTMNVSSVESNQFKISEWTSSKFPWTYRFKMIFQWLCSKPQGVRMVWARLPMCDHVHLQTSGQSLPCQSTVILKLRILQRSRCQIDRQTSERSWCSLVLPWRSHDQSYFASVAKFRIVLCHPTLIFGDRHCNIESGSIDADRQVGQVQYVAQGLGKD